MAEPHSEQESRLTSLEGQHKAPTGVLGWAGQKEVSGLEDPFQQEAEGQKSETSMQLEEGLRIRCGSHEHSVLNTRICFGISHSLNWGKEGAL